MSASSSAKGSVGSANRSAVEDSRGCCPHGRVGDTDKVSISPKLAIQANIRTGQSVEVANFGLTRLSWKGFGKRRANSDDVGSILARFQDLLDLET